MYILHTLLSVAITFTVTYILTDIVAKYMRRIGHVGVDIHKPHKPTIPTSVGISIVIGMTFGCIVLVILNSTVWLKTMVLLMTMWICSIIGLIDDFKVLKGTTKMLATVIAIIPIIIGHLMAPDVIVLGRPIVPILRRLRLTIVYWLLLPLAIAGPANAVNMLEVLNGVMPITCSLALVPLILACIIVGDINVAVLATLLLSALLAYLPYNKYPAKVFSGDTGSLAVGGAIGALAILGRVELVAMAALSPHIMNAFYVVSFMRGFKEHREIPRPVKVSSSGVIMDSLNPRAPITLVRMIVGKEGASEVEVVKGITIVQLISSVIALALALLMR